ncbi:hypothetical protein JF531_10745 [Microbacterium esteraromaticum]|uniref:hypothetical protein n=1 Tax=Microbacterium esteraromaticum TaxID=57043 RepID=UPI001A901AD6|nr:hypothetical protein [Microbacterium esteraromaticum]MBN8424998.1 hypothetical protein [Microbacterium esteraromaticum]
MTRTDLTTAAVRARQALAAAWSHEDPHLTLDGLRAYQSAEVARIRATLHASMPEEPTMPDRGPVLDTLRPKSADDHATYTREREKVRALVYAGQDPSQGFEREPGMRLQDVIAAADRTRLAAILDDLEVMPHLLVHEDRDRLLAAYEGLIWDRLTQVDPAARAVAEEERAAAEPAAWRAILGDLEEHGEPTQESLSLLHRADPDGYRLLMDGDRVHIDVPGSGNGIRYMLEDLERATA